MQILNIAGYRFIQLQALSALRSHFLAQCNELGLKGTILLSDEGINLSLAGNREAVHQFKSLLDQDERFAKMKFHETYSSTIPFKYLKVKLKKEIITLRQAAIDAVKSRAPSVAPAVLKQWLDEKQAMTLLDTRNEYEIAKGTFRGAVNLHLNHFTDFPAAVAHIAKENIGNHHPIVMFCTGGIRCEKAALYMLEQGFSHVYQLEGGILNYFAAIGGAHYEGGCFVFDERESLTPNHSFISNQN